MNARDGLKPDLRCGDWREVLADVGEVDAVIVDAPYSARTHGGHDAALNPYSRSTHGKQQGGAGGAGYEVTGYKPTSAVFERRAINYDGWHPEDVQAFVDAWAPRCRGWFVTITDHVLAPHWSAALASHGRYVFAPLPWVAPGGRVRLAGDGPSSWTCWIVVARPRSGVDRNGRKYSKWGTLPGAYVETQDRGAHIGGKPLKLMRRLVQDYTRPGDLIADPCAGGGTTLLAAAQEGRRSVGAELDPETHAKTQERLDAGLQQADLWTMAEHRKAVQGGLDLGGNDGLG